MDGVGSVLQHFVGLGCFGGKGLVVVEWESTYYLDCIVVVVVVMIGGTAIDMDTVCAFVIEVLKSLRETFEGCNGFIVEVSAFDLLFALVGFLVVRHVLLCF